MEYMILLIQLVNRTQLLTVNNYKYKPLKIIVKDRKDTLD